MKNYTITVNGTVYDVTVEESTNGSQAEARPVPQKIQQAPIVEKSVSKPAGNGAAIETGAAGKVLKILVHPGDAVESGTTIAILEIMKMETPIVSSKSGIIESILVTVGEEVGTGAVIATLN
ncbi:MAG: biotin/lipoyl-containing protein [Lachnospiraceae bacterium]